MKQYIDKASLVEALNKNIKSITRLLDLSKEKDLDIHLLSKVHAYEDMLDFVNALEVKELQIPQHEENTCKENDDSLTSEDERIRKALLEYFGEECDTATINGIYCYKIYNWLEKQGETSPVLSNSLNTGKREIIGNEEKISHKWSKEDEEEFKIAIETLYEAGQHSSAMWLNSLKQRLE